MNERIEELAKYCGYNGDYCTEDFSLEMFAELIVQECAKLADEPTSRPYESYGEKIKKHFGVK